MLKSMLSFFKTPEIRQFLIRKNIKEINDEFNKYLKNHSKERVELFYSDISLSILETGISRISPTFKKKSKSKRGSVCLSISPAISKAEAIFRGLKVKELKELKTFKIVLKIKELLPMKGYKTLTESIFQSGKVRVNRNILPFEIKKVNI